MTGALCSVHVPGSQGPGRAEAVEHVPIPRLLTVVSAPLKVTFQTEGSGKTEFGPCNV